MTETKAITKPGQGLVYPFENRPENGQTIEIAPGVLWVRMRLPFQLNHINLWLLEDGEGWTVVDTGVRDGPTADAWKALLAGVMAGRPVKRVVVTHLHPDHVGMAGWLVRRFDCMLWMSRTDYLMCRNLVADTGQEAPKEGVRFYHAAGFTEEMLEMYRTRFGGFGQGVYTLPSSYRRLVDREEVEIGGRRWQVVVGRGHAPEHVCLWCRELNLFISGDQILPRISSNVSLFPTEPEADPLREWLQSCAMLRDLLPEDVLVLPSHNEPFRGARLRLQELIEEHEANLDKLVALCAAPMRAVDCFPALFRARITAGNYGMATGESLAHLNCLLYRGRLTKRTDEDGVDWYLAK
ncbi:MAG: MBL fold metallo-hydrolase [Alphaproteobacteria bacterium]|nr:MBL fold metallo-hydrolase [Alphaproteobacteria bacterium]MBU6472712.1 MBL fold metallo-hydrolase [Alphaproteobacteria bacterium]MDE2013428.1 MBL fold metallo-hydrolase [Alphaproteobacteria bacterium]MDE2073279.1 MBL fold metallo-hydrolase [Alphaproteobacteria bacterium]MDE2351213.1 MBL fold metallo-hydrolase [Alphaproteobacteria bacterium]